MAAAFLDSFPRVYAKSDCLDKQLVTWKPYNFSYKTLLLQSAYSTNLKKKWMNVALRHYNIHFTVPSSPPETITSFQSSKYTRESVFEISLLV